MDTIKMKKHGIRAVALLLVLAMLLMTCGCGLFSSPKSVVLRFLQSIQQGDMEKLVKCLKPSAQDKINAVTDFSDNLFGIDTDELLGSFLGSIYDKISDDCEFKIVDVRKGDSSHADVDVDILVKEDRIDTVTVSCVKEDGKWYIDP